MKRSGKHKAVNRAIAKMGGPVATADYLGVRYQTVNLWQKNGCLTDLLHAYRLSKATGIDISEFANDLESARELGVKGTGERVRHR